MNNIDFLLLLNNSLVKPEYTIIFMFVIFSIFLSLLIVSVTYVFIKQNPESEKLSAYECGFEPLENTRHLFDIKFCVVGILFLIFDIEIIFLVPWCGSIAKLNLLSFWSMIDFILELCSGFFYIWYAKALYWN